MTLRDKVARALHVDGFGRDPGPEQRTCSSCERDADVAIAAVHEHLAEPTPAMLAALAREKALLGRHLTVGQAWRAMLEAALTT